jgi:hypothetical protein
LRAFGDLLQTRRGLSGSHHAFWGQWAVAVVAPASRVTLEGNSVSNDEQIHAGL